MRCHLLQFLEIFTFRSPVGVQVQSGFGTLLIWRESRSLFPAVWQPKDCLIVPGRGPSNKIEESTCRGVFSNRQKSLVARCDVHGHCLLGACCERMVLLHRSFSTAAIRPLQCWSRSPFFSSESKEAGARGPRHLATVSKRESLSPRGVDLEFRRISADAFGQGIWRLFINFANWVLIMPLVHLALRVEGSK